MAQINPKINKKPVFFAILLAMIVSISATQIDLSNLVYGQSMNHTTMSNTVKEGSIPLSKITSAFLESIKSNLNFSLSTAIVNAENIYPGSKAISGSLENHNDFLVYVVNIINKDNHLYKIILDPNSGHILNSTQVGSKNPHDILMGLHNIIHGNNMNMMSGGLNMMNMDSGMNMPDQIMDMSSNLNIK